MPARDSVLIEILTAANMQGVNEAKAGFLGLNSGAIAASAGLSLMFVAGRSAIDITEKHEAAQKDLAQALDATGTVMGDANGLVQNFIDSNRAYISDQSEVIDGYASLIRSGISANEVQRDMNRAVDLAALKHISLSDAVNLLVAAEHGRTRGLIDLGITTSKYTDAQGNVINQGKNMALVMQEIDQKTAHGRETLTETQQATNQLSNDWQDMANMVGPPLVGIIAEVADAADHVFHALKSIGDNKDWAKFVSDAFGHWQDLIVGIVSGIKTILIDLGILQDTADQHKPGSMGPGAYRSASSGTSRFRAAGGPVWPGTWIVGESGPETLHLGGGGMGYIEPNAGSSSGASSSTHIHIHVDRGAFIDGPSVDRLSMAVAQRLSFVTGR